MRRLFAVMGMAPVGYYDLTVEGVPVRSTAFRPVLDETLARNPFRVFASLLRLELIEDTALRQDAAATLARRHIFARKARRAHALRQRLARTSGRLVSLDVATGLLFDDGYQEAAPVTAPPVVPIEHLLLGVIASGSLPPRPMRGPEYRLHLHWTQRTARPDAAEQWRKVLRHFGLNATVAAVGCCGMAGMFGHEAEHAALSPSIFDLGWRESASAAPPEAMLANGFSCRCQTKRLAGHRPRHPVEAILDRLESTEA